MHQKLIAFNKRQRTKEQPILRAGDIVRLVRKIVEGDKERLQTFEGIVIAVKGGQSASPMVTVRKVTDGIGVELTLPLHSPSLESITVVKRARVRRAKLYYLRRKSTKSLRMKYQELTHFVREEDGASSAISSAPAETETAEEHAGMSETATDAPVMEEKQEEKKE